MTGKKIAAILCCLFIVFTSTHCGIQQNSIEKLWFYTHSAGTLTDRDTLLNPASFISLNKDGTYVFDLEKFEYGTWRREGNTLLFNNSRKHKSSISIESLSAKEIQLAISDFTPANFESQPGKFKSPNENPFSIESNLWRVQADKKESDEQLRMRLLNHLHFWELYFSWALDNGLSTIDVRSTPTLVKIYGNGFALKTFDQLPLKWKTYFFDEDDCRKANDMLTKVFQASDIAWAHTDNKYKMFISAFQQLQQKMKR